MNCTSIIFVLIWAYMSCLHSFESPGRPLTRTGSPSTRLRKRHATYPPVRTSSARLKSALVIILPSLSPAVCLHLRDTAPAACKVEGAVPRARPYFSPLALRACALWPTRKGTCGGHQLSLIAIVPCLAIPLVARWPRTVSAPAGSGNSHLRHRCLDF